MLSRIREQREVHGQNEEKYREKEREREKGAGTRRLIGALTCAATMDDALFSTVQSDYGLKSGHKSS